jgi:hypothetical protein
LYYNNKNILGEKQMANYTKDRYNLSSGNLSELNWLKQQARKKGYEEGTMLENIPSYYHEGQCTEIAVLGILGVTQRYLKEKGIKFWIQASKELDRLGVDVQINNETIQLKSKFTYNVPYSINPDICYVEYDAVGMVNLEIILDHIGFEAFFMDKEFKAKINKLWTAYMKRFDIID